MKLRALVIFMSMFVLMFSTLAYAYDQHNKEGGNADKVSAIPLQTATPRISISPVLPVSFGAVKVNGTSSPKMVTIWNRGVSDLVIGDISITGLNPTEFSQTNDCTTIPAGTSCTITATFNPALPFGRKTATVSIPSNDPVRPTVNVKISGNAPPPKMSISPVLPVSFGAVKVNGTSSPKTVRILNRGISDLEISSISITGLYPAEFSQTNDCTTIPAGSSCTVTATFNPALPFGQKSAFVSISSNDPIKLTANVKISGKASPPKISVSPVPAIANFGPVQVCGTSSPKTVTISNRGISDLVISGVSITDLNSSEFNQTNDCTTISAGGSCTITGTFSPTSTGSKNGTMAISSNDPLKPTVNVRLLGRTIGGGTSCVTISSLSTSSAVPLSLLTITGSGFNPAAELAVRFFDDAQGYSLSIPVVAASSTTITVSVPPFTLSPGTFSSGTVNVQVIQSSSVSNTIGNFEIQNLPTSLADPGTVTLSFLKANVAVGWLLQNEIQGTSLDTTALNDSLSNQISNMETVASNVQALMQDPYQTFTIGEIEGTPITIDQNDLQSSDRMILAMLSGIGPSASPPYMNSIEPAQVSTGCMQTEASNYVQNCAGEDPEVCRALGQELVYAPRQSINCKTADAFNTAYLVVGGAGAVGIGVLALAGVPAIALALPAAAMLYVTVEGAGGMIAVGGALGQTTAGAAEMVQNGVQMVQDLIRDSIIKIPLSETAGNLYDIAMGSKSLIDAFTSAPPPSPPVQPITLSPAIINTSIQCVRNPPPGTGSFTLWSGTVSVNASENLSWTVNIPALPESGSSVTVTPSSGKGPMSVNVAIMYPGKFCWCPCSLSWASGRIAEFRYSDPSVPTTPVAGLLVDVDCLSCYCD